MLNLLIFIILAYGITNIVTYSTLFEPIRNFFDKINPGFLGKLFSCPLCFSTWVGFLLSFIFQYYNVFTPLTFIGVHDKILSVFLDGCFTSGTTWILYVLVDCLLELHDFISEKRFPENN